VQAALRRGCASISCTYSEPTIHYEHNRDVGVRARAAGLRNVFVTNGLMTVEAVKDAASSFLDAANIDLKAMRAETYREHCLGPLAAVLDCIRAMHAAGVWIEVTTLVIPALNDDERELRDAARFLRSLGPDVPWHLSRYHPAHRYEHAPRTPVDTLRRAREIGLGEGLRYVYTGNVWGDEGEHTYCPSCGQIAIRRHGFDAEPEGMRAGSCTRCQTPIAGIEMP
jgi:pyruvate formate lyase activating enzyme